MITDEFFKIIIKLKKSKFSNNLKIRKLRIFFFIHRLNFLSKEKIIFNKLISDFIFFKEQHFKNKNIMHYSIFTLEQWLLLQALYIQFGKFKDALFFRNQAKLLVRKNRFKKNYFERYLGILYEKNNLILLNKLYKKYKQKLSPSKTAHIETMLSINNFGLKSKQNECSALSNKKILIIGPNSEFKLNKRENYDFYALLNNFYFPNRQKNKTIRIFSGDFVNNTSKKIIKELINNSAIVFFQYSEHKKNFLNKENKKKLLYLDANFHNFFNGKPNGIQRALIYLLQFKPSKIMLTNFNFFLNLGFQKNYQSTKLATNNISRYFRGLAFHDIFFQFIFTKNLYKNNLVSVDYKIKKILSMSLAKYSILLNRNWCRKILNL
jgi:hypothetical protein